MPPKCHTMEMPILGKTHCSAGRWTMTERMEIKDLNRVEMGKRIRERRELLKMSRDELARRLDVTSKFIADLEYGEKGASVKNLYHLKQILGVSVDYLMDGNPSNQNETEPRKMLNENIMGSLSVCNVKQLRVMEQIARLYIEGVVNNEEDSEE